MWENHLYVLYYTIVSICKDVPTSIQRTHTTCNFHLLNDIHPPKIFALTVYLLKNVEIFAESMKYGKIILIPTAKFILY